MSYSTAIEWGMYVNAGVGSSAMPGNTGDGKDYARYVLDVLPPEAIRLTDAPIAGVALPRDANCAYIAVSGGAVRIRVGSADATVDDGVVWFADTAHTFENQRSFLENVSIIQSSDGAEITVLYGRVSA